jgi:hypothetical protein
MTIKITQKKGISIESKLGEAILENDKVVIYRKNNPEKGSFEVTSPGEYEVEFIGVSAYEPYPTFSINVEGFNITYLPDPPKQLSAAIKDILQQTDILILPGDRHEVTESIAPSIIIPMNQIETYVKDAAVELPEVQKSLTMKKPSELPDETQIINLG